MEIIKIVNEKVRDNTDKRTFIKQLKHFFFIKPHIAKICNCKKNKCILAIFLLCLIMENFLYKFIIIFSILKSYINAIFPFLFSFFFTHHI